MEGSSVSGSVLRSVKCGICVCARAPRRHSQFGLAQMRRENSGTHLPESQVHTRAINSGSELQARYNHESEQQDSFQPASLPGRRSHGMTGTERANGGGNHSSTSVQVMCGRVRIECGFSGVSLIILCYCHNQEGGGGGEKSSAALKEK